MLVVMFGEWYLSILHVVVHYSRNKSITWVYRLLEYYLAHSFPKRSTAHLLCFINGMTQSLVEYKLENKVADVGHTTHSTIDNE